jgi:hypothetical protein
MGKKWQWHVNECSFIPRNMHVLLILWYWYSSNHHTRSLPLSLSIYVYIYLSLSLREVGIENTREGRGYKGREGEGEGGVA